ncbi:MAG: hypothetical protein R3F53_13250 [Gammaproteobacteria bacterium]
MPEDELSCLPGETFTLTTTISGPGTVLQTPDLANYSCGELVTLTAQPNVGAMLVGWGGMLSGTANPNTLIIEENFTVTADFAADTTPPVITNLTVTVDETFAILTWETDETATSSVAYGECSV